MTPEFRAVADFTLPQGRCIVVSCPLMTNDVNYMEWKDKAVTINGTLFIVEDVRFAACRIDPAMRRLRLATITERQYATIDYLGFIVTPASMVDRFVSKVI